MQRDGRVAERHLLIVCRNQVPGWTRTELRLVQQIPVGRRQHHPRLVSILQELRSPDVVAVCMADDHVFDVGRIQSELRQPSDDLILDRVVVEGVDDDDPRRCLQGPRRELRLSHPVQIVEDLRRLGVPRGSRRRPGGSASPLGWCGRRGRAAASRPRLRVGRRTQLAEQLHMVRARRRPGSGHMTLDRICRSLSASAHRRRERQSQSRRESEDPHGQLHIRSRTACRTSRSAPGERKSAAATRQS